MVYIGLKGDKFDSLQAGSSDLDFTAFISAGKFRRYHGKSVWAHLLDVRTLVLNFLDIFKVIGGVLMSRRILKKVSPSVVFSKGGYVVLPVGVAARMYHIPIVTHDSDVVPGLANKIIGRWASVRTSGSDSAPEVLEVGIPLNPEIKLVTPAMQVKFKKELNIDEDSQVLLVAGGGLGAADINNSITAASDQLLASNLALHIIHIAGAKHEKSVKRIYSELLDEVEAKRVQVLGFATDFYKYSGAADLIISRAGATSIAEFAQQAKACILIPSAVLAGGHQLANARVLAKKQAAVVLEGKTTPEHLLVAVQQLLSDPVRRQQLATNLHTLAQPDAGQKIAKILLDVVARPRA